MRLLFVQLSFEADILVLIHSVEGIKEACLYSDGGRKYFPPSQHSCIPASKVNQVSV